MNLLRSLDNLLNYFRSQLPLFTQNKSKDEVRRMVQTVAIYLRNIILQVEGEAYFDPSKTAEFLQLQSQNRVLKDSKEHFEEKLFLADQMSREIGQEIERTLARFVRAEREVQKVQSDVSQLERELSKSKSVKRLPPPPTATEEEINSLEKKIREIQEGNQLLKDLLTRQSGEMASLVSKRDRLEEAVQPFREKGAKTGFQDEGPKFEIQEISKKLVHTQETLKNLNIENEIKAKTSKQAIKIQEGRMGELKKASAEFQKAPVRDAKALATAQLEMESKIVRLQKEFDEVVRRLGEKKSGDDVSSNIERLQREKKELQQRIIDLEAVLERFDIMERESELQQVPGERKFGLEECVFFFECFSMVKTHLPKFEEFEDIKFMAKEALRIFLDTKTLEPIPTIGNICEENFHKVEKVFFSRNLKDNMIVFEAFPGYLFRNQVVQRAIVWISKSKFGCISCGTMTEGKENFCPKCGMELFVFNGILKKDIPSLPASLEDRFKF